MGETTFFRTKKEKNYTVIDNTFLKDERLSAGAKGVFAYLLYLPEDWVIYQSELKNHFSNGKDSIRSIISELEEFGYIVKEKAKSEGGKFSGYKYQIIESPRRENRNGSTATENPTSENPQLPNTNNNQILNLPNTKKKGKVNKSDEELEILFSEFEIKEVNIAKTCINNFYIKKRSNDSKYARTPNQLRNWTYQLLKFSKDSERGIEEVAKVWNYIINDSYSMPYLSDVKKFVSNFEKYIQKCNTSLSRYSYSQKQSLVGSEFDKAHENTVFDHKDEGEW